MKKACRFAVLLLTVTMILVPIYALAAADSSASLPMATAFPHVTFHKIPVNIPDPNLRAALHSKTGIPSASPIYASDLQALDGSLLLPDKHIANAEGLQHCTNVDWLDLSGNDLTALPSSMSNLKTLGALILRENKMNAFPTAILGMTGLTRLSLDKNPIKTIPSGISALVNLKYLIVNSCSLTGFPNSLYSMNKIETIQAGKNSISSISAAISGMTSLVDLSLQWNKLGSIPKEICTLPALKFLNVAHNEIYDLPSDIGKSKIGAISVDFNRIDSLPKSIGDSNYIYYVTASYNRLTALPSNFDDNDYEIIDIEFNFIDMASGSPARTMMDSIVCGGEKRYLRQLKPVTHLTAQGTNDSIALSWQAGQNGSANFITWKVQGYVVYILEAGNLKKLADLNASTLAYTHTGLNPDVQNTYRVGVDYYITGDDLNYDTRCYTEIKASTLAPGASPTPTPGPTPSAAAESGLQPQTQGTPGWLFAVLGVTGASALGAVSYVLIRRTKKTKE